jgi:hypothetical protein
MGTRKIGLARKLTGFPIHWEQERLEAVGSGNLRGISTERWISLGDAALFLKTKPHLRCTRLVAPETEIEAQRLYTAVAVSWNVAESSRYTGSFGDGVNRCFDAHAGRGKRETENVWHGVCTVVRFTSQPVACVQDQAQV